IIDGKARLISDLFCDGLGACIGECPEDAISIEKREAVPYDEKKVMGNIVKQGEATIIAHLKHLNDHNETGFLSQATEYLESKGMEVPDYTEEPRMACGCPGSMAQEIKKDEKSGSDVSGPVESELTQWPIQAQLINPGAPYFKNADLLIAADCVSFSYGDFHRKFLKDKKLIIFCPKLDTTIDAYIEKLAELFRVQDIKSITVAHMEVPCCFGTEQIVKTALQKSGKDIPINIITISVQGEVI
ncbi:MAG: 4Fe-4S ferredoxin, partial [bacterium]|nr:4Fe-4S ferredoxin [bacterium]